MMQVKGGKFICQYVSLIVSDIFGNPFPNVTHDCIGNFLPLIIGSLPGDLDQNPPSEDAKYCPS